MPDSFEKSRTWPLRCALRWPVALTQVLWSVSNWFRLCFIKKHEEPKKFYDFIRAGYILFYSIVQDILEKQVQLVHKLVRQVLQCSQEKMEE